MYYKNILCVFVKLSHSLIPFFESQCGFLKKILLFIFYVENLSSMLVLYFICKYIYLYYIYMNLPVTSWIYSFIHYWWMEKNRNKTNLNDKKLAKWVKVYFLEHFCLTSFMERILWLLDSNNLKRQIIWDVQKWLWTHEQLLKTKV